MSSHSVGSPRRIGRIALSGVFAAAIASLALMPVASFAANETCNGIPATVFGGPGDDVLEGTNGNDVIVGLGGNDTINGLKGNDLICGDDGNDSINGSFGDDTAFGGRGDDSILGDKGRDTLFGDLGNDSLNGGVEADSCDGGVGNDTSSNCESAVSMGLIVKRVSVPNGGFTPLSSALAGQTIPALDGGLYLPKSGAKRIAIVSTHGTSGRFDQSVPGWMGWWMEQYGVAVLSLNRRDSSAYGAGEGGGGTIYEDTLCDLGVGVDYMVSLGFKQVIVQGHSKGTTVAGVYPSYYNKCPGKTALKPPNDAKVAGVINIGTVVDPREAGTYAPYGPYYYDVNAARAAQLVGMGLGGVLFPPGAPPVFGPQFFLQPPGFTPGPPPLPAIPSTITPASYASYNGVNTLRNVERESQKLVVPHLIIHAEGDRTTLRSWSDRLFQTLTNNGNLVTYETPLYESLGYPNPGTGGNAHGLQAEGSRFDAAQRIYAWMASEVQGATEPASGIRMNVINALPDFSPALVPPATTP